jgi:hypothetical protein
VSLMSCGWGNLYNFRQYYRLILCWVVHTAVQNYSILLSSLEIIDRTKYVRSILHHGFYNPYYMFFNCQKNVKFRCLHYSRTKQSA